MTAANHTGPEEGTRQAESSDPGCEGDEHLRRDPSFPPAAFHRASSLFRALGDPERLRVLELLLAGEACVTELAATTEAAVSTVSQRLKVLRAEGLVARRRDGKHIYYSLADEHVAGLVQTGLLHALEPQGTQGEREG